MRAEGPSIGRIIARSFAAGLLGLLLFAGLWITTFTAMTAAIVAAGVTVCVGISSVVLDAVAWVLDAIASVFAGIFDFFN